MNVKILKKDSKKGFSYLDGINRPVVPNQVTKLAKSLLKMGCIRPVVVAKCEFINPKEMYIIDGQHLFNGLLRNNMDIPYIEIVITNKVDLVETIALLNASSRSWAMVDYVTAWGSISNDYKKLKSYHNIYDFDISVIASILMGMNGTTGGSTLRKIKGGEFSISNEKSGVETLDRLTDILKILPRMNRFENKYLCTEYVQFLKWIGSKYDHKKFMDVLKKHKEELVLSTQEEGRLAEIFKRIL